MKGYRVVFAEVGKNIAFLAAILISVMFHAKNLYNPKNYKKSICDYGTKQKN